MKKNLRYFMTLLLVMVASVGWGQTTITDVLNQSFTGVTGTNYAEWSGKTGTSGAVYAGNSAGSYNSIQLRSNNNNSGVVSTTSGGKLKKIVVTWNSETANGRTLNVYGSKSAYTAATDLYKSSKQGTLLGTIVYGTSTELTVEDEYQYVGLRSASGAMYLDEVKITWESSSTETPTCATPTFSPAAGAVAAGTNVTIRCATEGATIYYTTDGTDPTTGSTPGTSVTVNSEMTIKAIAVKSGMDNSAVASAAYTVFQPVSGYTIDFESPFDAYADWTFKNAEQGTDAITAHGGTYYATTGGNASAVFQTKERVAKPTTFTCYVSKLSTNTTSSTWYVEVSSDGDSWTEVASQSATVMDKGSWKEITANLGLYSNVYVRLRYQGSTAVRAVDDISIVEGGKMTANVTISPTQINIGETATVSTDENAPAVTLSTSNSAIASVDGTTVTGVAAGTATITATWEEDDNYNGGEKEFTITVVDPNGPGTENNPYTVAQARAAIDASAGITSVYATGIVSEIPTVYSTQYKNITFNFVDNEGDEVYLQAYRCIGDEAANVRVGDIVVVKGNLTKHNTTYEFGQGCELVSLTHTTSQQEAGLAFSETTASADLANPSSFTAPTLDNPNSLAVTYSSSNEAVATVTADGKVNLEGVGTTTITASSEATSEYLAGTASYTLTVMNSAVQLVTVDSEGNVTFNLTENGWGFPTDKNVNKGQYTNSDYTLTIEGSEGNGYYFFTNTNGDPYTALLMGKSGAYLELPAFDFDVEKIEVTGASNASASVVQNIFVGENAASTETTGAKGTNIYEIGADYQAKGNIYTLKVTSNHNTQITSIKVYKKQDVPANITLSPAKEYTTLTSAYALDFSAVDGLAAYIVKEGDVTATSVKLTPVSKVPAKTGLVLQKTGTARDYVVPTFDGAGADDVSLNKMEGSATETTAIAEKAGYILKDGKFYPSEAGTLDAGKAYLAVAVPAGAKDLNIVFGEGTGINNVNVNENENGKIFNLSGQQMKSAVKGVYIKNGKKYIK